MKMFMLRIQVGVDPREFVFPCLLGPCLLSIIVYEFSARLTFIENLGIRPSACASKPDWTYISNGFTQVMCWACYF